jgi:hypothetical protein
MRISMLYMQASVPSKDWRSEIGYDERLQKVFSANILGSITMLKVR